MKTHPAVSLPSLAFSLDRLYPRLSITSRYAQINQWSQGWWRFAFARWRQRCFFGAKTMPCAFTWKCLIQKLSLILSILTDSISPFEMEKITTVRLFQTKSCSADVRYFDSQILVKLCVFGQKSVAFRPWQNISSSTNQSSDPSATHSITHWLFIAPFILQALQTTLTYRRGCVRRTISNV